jgi:hypothetical protein
LRILESPAGRQYRLESRTPVRVRHPDIDIRGRSALVIVSPRSVRVRVAQRQFLQLRVAGIAVRGMGPFDFVFNDESVRGRCDGETRTLVVSKPPSVVRPGYRMDGLRWMPGFPDETSDWEGAPEVQFSVAFGVTAGPHTVEVAEWSFPRVPGKPVRRALRATPSGD